MLKLGIFGSAAYIFVLMTFSKQSRQGEFAHAKRISCRLCAVYPMGQAAELLCFELNLLGLGNEGNHEVRSSSP